ncbi:predicted protein [Botrytis cinerea T4]|uniref:Uncharacterized protein n=1 Tax=Botryotinia fuckeliana (strain T4) TaxID=999810 RepID=G2Y7N3_BOTF4|nr:predicted protein [Botrytis cinerea T4]
MALDRHGTRTSWNAPYWWDFTRTKSLVAAGAFSIEVDNADKTGNTYFHCALMDIQG